MFEMFLNPWAMAAGTLLISSPIIIHLINRMRYRRIRWAAMEFLLKSQKKNRRRVIIEQIILLLLRILLVLLAGFLLARFIGALAGPQQSTLHVVVLDDTPSMGDFHVDGGRRLEAFTEAKSIIAEKIGQFASQANTPQSLVLLRLSDLENPRRIDRLNSSTVDELRTYLSDLEPTTFHVDLVKGLHAAEAEFNKSKEARRLLHIVSDFRSIDWTGAAGDSLGQALEQFKAMKIDVHPIDAAYPQRAENQKSIQYHDNMAIVDLTPETRVVARYMQVEFTVAVANFSNSERKNVRVTVRVRGQERADGSFNMPSVPAGTVTTGSFSIPFDQLGQNPVSVNLENEETGLTIDNVRHCVVEVREKVPLLVIEGDSKTKGTPDGDGYFLQQLFSESTRGFDVLMRTPNDLEKLNLEEFPSIFLLNVARLTDKAVQALEKFVQGGGGLAFFMGKDVKQDFYNKLYADGKGLFPVPLADKPSDPPANAEVKLSRMLENFSPKVYPRNLDHPVFTRIYRDEKSHQPSRENNKYLVFAGIDQYWPVPRQRWHPKAGETEELMTLPNVRQISDYADQTNVLLKDMLKALADATAQDQQRWAKFKAPLDEAERKIKNILLVGGELYKLVAPLDALLNEAGEPNLQEFWQYGPNADLRDRFSKLLETVRFGDPYLVVKTIGKGRVLACMSTANSEWNDMPGGPSRVYWVMLMLEMQKYMASNTADANLTLGNSLDLELDATRFDANIQRFAPPKIDYGKTGQVKYAAVDMGRQAGDVTGNKLSLHFNEARTPGVYEFILTRKDVDGANAKPGDKSQGDKGRQETIAYAFNVDAAAEGNLKRVTSDEFKAVSGNIGIHTPDDPAIEALLKDKKSDYSESPWMYLIILLVLIAEQAMAVRLSFHTRHHEASPTFASPASAPVPEEAPETVEVG
jgi:hypothetical protein